MNKLGYLVFILVTVIAFSGCAGKAKKPTASPGTTNGVLGGDGSQTNLDNQGGASSETSGGGPSGTTGGGGNIPSERVIHFDYDMSDIRPEARTLLEQHAAYLSGNPNTQVRLEGHADERGSREYNLALGERRAESAKGALMSLGVSGNQITTLSYGEERPVALGHNEHDWQLNRRVEIIYP